MRGVKFAIGLLVLATVAVVPAAAPRPVAHRSLDPNSPAPWRLGYTSSGCTQLFVKTPGGDLRADVPPYDAIDCAAEGAFGGPPAAPALVWISAEPAAGQGPGTDGEVWYRPGTSTATSVQLTNDAFEQHHPVLSPDGTRVAYSSDEAGGDDIWVMELSTRHTTQLTTDPAADTWPSWSADGGTLAFSSTRDDPAGEIYTMPATGGAATRLTADPAADTEPALGPDGTIAFTTTRYGARDVALLAPATRAVTRLLPGTWGGSARRASSGQAAWNADGHRLAFVTDHDDDPTDAARGQSGDLYGVTLPSTVPYALVASPHVADGHPSWQGDRLLYDGPLGSHSTDIWAADGHGQYPADLTRRTGSDEADPAWSPDGTRIAFTEWTGYYSRVVVTDADGRGHRTELTPGYARDGQPAWSPDGTRIAFLREPVLTLAARAGVAPGSEVQGTVVIIDAVTGAEIRRIPQRGPFVGADASPTWSPDGRRIAVSRYATVYQPAPNPIPLDPARRVVGVHPGGTASFVTTVGPYPSAAHVTVTSGTCGGGVDYTVTPAPGAPSDTSSRFQVTVTAAPDARPDGYADTCLLSYLISDGPTYELEYQRVPVHVFGPGAPVIDVDDVTVRTTDPTGGPVTVPATATAADGSHPAVTCVPGSGGRFPVGSTGVRCTATDADGRTGTAQVTVALYTPDHERGGVRLWLLDADAPPDSLDQQIDLSARFPAGRCPTGRHDRGPDWSPDGARIAFVARADASGSHDVLCVADLAGPTATLVTLDPTVDTVADPAWSPDGKLIAFTNVGEDPCESGGDLAAGGCAVTDNDEIWEVSTVDGSSGPVLAPVGGAAQPTFRRLMDLRVTLRAQPTDVPVTTGSTLTLTVTNAGSLAARNAHVVLALPAGLRAEDVESPRPGCAAPPEPPPTTPAALDLTCDFAAVAVGETIEVKVQVTAVLLGTQPVRVTVTSALADVSPADNTADARLVVERPRDLFLGVTVNPLPGYVGGDDVVVTYTATNGAEVPASGVSLKISLPAAALPAGSVTPSTCTVTGCALGTLPPGGTATVVIVLPARAAVNGQASGVLVSQLDEQPADRANNTASSLLVIKQPALVVDPKVLRLGQVAMATGRDFPPGTRLRLTWSLGISTIPGEVTVAADGTFAGQVLVFHLDRVGTRELRAEYASGTRFGTPPGVPVLVEPPNPAPPWDPYQR
ncbi:hypothetical protein R8Z50_13170 [Longispora sp. K20-0274]|uniref:hypothetical protein n=1 Tax=Longispora sp. K20-0274 TaxID=3088255 RepID=UPI0039995DEE